MELKEYNELLPTLPPEEKQALQLWFIEYQDRLSWETFKGQGYRDNAVIKADIEAHILEATGKPQQLKLAFMPTAMARTSPFFVMGVAEKKERPVFQDLVIENAWGRITVSGPKLSIHDETILLALLVLAKKHKADRFKTSCAEICSITGINRGKNQYTAIIAAVKRLVQATVDTQLFKAGSPKKEIVRSVIGHFLDEADTESESGKISVRINSLFLTIYAANLTTSIDVTERSMLRSDTGKALYRFIRTHAPGPVPFGLLTICHGIGLDTDQPLTEIRRQIKAAIAELKRHGFLKGGFVDKSDRVFLTR